MTSANSWDKLLQLSGLPSGDRYGRDASIDRCASDADRHVGAKIRKRRAMLGLSQQRLAAIIGVSYQQIQKYEGGLNRVSAGRLLEFAEALASPVGWFFEGLAAAPHQNIASSKHLGAEFAQDFALLSQRQQNALTQIARALAEQSATYNSEILPELDT